MIQIEFGLYVRIQQMAGERAPRPLPLDSGFEEDVAYRVLGVFNASESSDAFLILSNARDELWFICNRHVRTDHLDPAGPFRKPLRDASTKKASA